MTDLVRTLAQGPAHAFSDWPVDAVPDVAAGVYTIWDQDRLVYVGMSGRGKSKEELDELRSKGKRSGLFGRLASHAVGLEAAISSAYTWPTSWFCHTYRPSKCPPLAPAS